MLDAEELGGLDIQGVAGGGSLLLVGRTCSLSSSENLSAAEGGRSNVILTCSPPSKDSVLTILRPGIDSSLIILRADVSSGIVCSGIDTGRIGESKIGEYDC